MMPRKGTTKAFLGLTAAGICLSLLLLQGYNPTSPSLQDSQPMIVYVDDDNVSGYEDGSLLHPFNTISEGVDAVADGGTVHVFEGNYTETVEIRKSVILEGASSSQTIVTNQSQNVIFIWADNVTVRNFHIKDGLYVGIHVQFSANVTIGNVILSNLTRGIYVDSSAFVTVSDSYIYDVRDGVLAVYLENGTVSDVVIDRASLGIHLSHAKSVTVSGNHVRDSGIGISIGGFLLSSSNLSIQGNTLIDNTWTGIGLVSASDSRVVGNIVEGSVRCLVSIDSLLLNVSLNRFEDCFDSIDFSNVTNATVYHNNMIPNGLLPPGVHDDGPFSNHWYHPVLLEGNYWSNYTGLDDGSGIGKHAIKGDSIGDTDIPFPAPGFDFYPFVKESGWENTTHDEELAVSLDIDPDTLNLKSKGRWITAYLSIENASVYDIDISSILLQDTLVPERYYYQDDVLMLKFDRQEFKDTVEVGVSIEVKMSGKWKDGTEFEAYDHIRITNPGRS